MSAAMDASKYAHSPAHKAVLARDHAALRLALASLPALADPSHISTEAASLAEEAKADAISAVIDRRDVPNRETPLHLAVRTADPAAVEILMESGADWSLQNEQGWSPLQEAICARQDTIAKIIVCHSHPLAWAKWRRRLPRLIATMKRMRDFYMEISFHFESSVIPFISTIAPSDTYKIWKRGPNLRADMTLAGFDGLRIQRSHQTILFLGDGEGSLLVISHKDREVLNALDRAGLASSEEEVRQEIAAMSKTSVFRPGIDVTQAVLVPQLTWRRQPRTEMVGPWKTIVYDMLNVVVSVKSRQVPGANDLFSSCADEEEIADEEEVAASGEFDDILTEEERKQLEAGLSTESQAYGHSCYEWEIPIEDITSSTDSQIEQVRKVWSGNGTNNGTANLKHDHKRNVPPRSSLCIDEKVSHLLEDDSPTRLRPRHSVDLADDLGRGIENDSTNSSSSSSLENRHKGGASDSEYRKGLRPVLYLSPDFPLRTEELLPLLDILASKVKAVRRLREFLTTKIPPGNFPVKLAIPVVPTIRVLVTFTKFQELHPSEEFFTPPSSHGNKNQPLPSSSWLQWMKVPYRQSPSMALGSSSRVEDIQDPFVIPPDYTWTTPEAKKKGQESKNKSKRRA